MTFWDVIGAALVLVIVLSWPWWRPRLGRDGFRW